MLGVRIGEKHTFRDWRLGWLEPYEIEYPEPEIRKVEVPGTDGATDLTERITGRVRYKNRKIQFNFEVAGNYFTYEQKKQEVASYVHGKRHKVYLDTDPSYYYDARLTLSAEKSDPASGLIVITGDAYPYKLNAWTTGENWEWDPFNFETGTIIEFKDIEVKGTRDVILPKSDIPVTPTFTCSAPVKITVAGKTYDLPAGVYMSPNIVIDSTEDTTIRFTGTATVSIDYKAGAL